MASTTAPQPREPASDLARKVLGAGAAGVGTIGFVTLVGGAVTFVRFGRAGLPADEAVAVQPKAVLLTLGGEALVPVGVAIVVGVTLFYLTDRTWRMTRAMMAPTRVRRTRSLTTKLLITGGSGALAALVYYAFAVSFSFDAGSAWVVFDTAFAAILWVLLGERIRSFAGRAIVLAVLIASLATAIGLSRTYGAPKVRGAAVFLKTSGKVVSGLFVAETTQSVYLGEVTPSTADGKLPRPGSGAIVVLERRDLGTIAIGSDQGLSRALADAGLMGAALRRDPDGGSIAAALAG